MERGRKGGSGKYPALSEGERETGGWMGPGRRGAKLRPKRPCYIGGLLGLALGLRIRFS